MMGYYGGWDMVGGMGFFSGIIMFVVLADLILAGIWLWQQIFKK